MLNQRAIRFLILVISSCVRKRRFDRFLISAYIPVGIYGYENYLHLPFRQLFLAPYGHSYLGYYHPILWISLHDADLHVLALFPIPAKRFKVHPVMTSRLHSRNHCCYSILFCNFPHLCFKCNKLCFIITPVNGTCTMILTSNLLRNG